MMMLQMTGLAGAIGATFALVYELLLHREQWMTEGEKTSAPPNVLRTIALTFITPLIEKNVIKTIGMNTPVVFSMSRVVVLAFAVAMLRHLCSAGIAGWPDATLAITVVLALPLLGALERAAPDQVAGVVKALLAKEL